MDRFALESYVDQLVRVKNIPEIRQEHRYKVGTVMNWCHFGPLKILYFEILLGDNSLIYCKPEWVSEPLETARCHVDPYWTPAVQTASIYAG